MEFDINFQKKDFDGMLIPVYDVSEKDDIVKGTVLEKFNEFKLNIRGLIKTKVIKWIFAGLTLIEQQEMRMMMS